MSGRTWIPAEWLDECVPACGASPADGPGDCFADAPDDVLRRAKTSRPGSIVLPLRTRIVCTRPTTSMIETTRKPSQ